MLRATETVAEIVAKHSVCAAVFQKHRIEFCCRGNVAVETACRDRGLDPSAVLVELEHAIAVRESDEPDVRSLSTPRLIAHIVSTHHDYLRRGIPFIRWLAADVRRLHGERNPRLVDLDLAVQALADTLMPHLDMEENELFPALVRGTRGPRVTARLARMQADHLRIAEQLGRIRAATDDFTRPPWASDPYRALCSELEFLEADVFRLVHLEGDVLVPRLAAAC